MPAFKQVHAKDSDKPNSETVGSANLKEVLTERHVVRGSFYLNGHEYRDFEARSPGEVVRKINAGTRSVRASIDDGYHLVLENDGAEDIRIASGADGDRERQSHAVTDAQRHYAQVDDAGRPREFWPDKDDAPDILELLGLTANSEMPGQAGADWAPGETAEQRRQRRENEHKLGRQPYRSVMGGRSPAEDARIAERQGREGGGTTALNQGPSNTTAPDPHAPPAGSAQDHADDGMGRAPPVGPQPGTTPAATEQPSL